MFLTNSEQQMIDLFTEMILICGHAVLFNDSDGEQILMVCDDPRDAEWLEAQHGK